MDSSLIKTGVHSLYCDVLFWRSLLRDTAIAYHAPGPARLLNYWANHGNLVVSGPLNNRDIILEAVKLMPKEMSLKAKVMHVAQYFSQVP